MSQQQWYETVALQEYQEQPLNTKMLKHVRQLFNVDYIPTEINRANQRKWIRSVRRLGDKWLFAKYLEKKNA